MRLKVIIKQTYYNQYLDSNQERQVYREPSNNGDNQIWTVYKNNDNSMFLKNAATGLYLEDSNGKNVYAEPYNGGDYQKWEFLDNRLVHCKTQGALSFDDLIDQFCGLMSLNRQLPISLLKIKLFLNLVF